MSDFQIYLIVCNAPAADPPMYCVTTGAVTIEALFDEIRSANPGLPGLAVARIGEPFADFFDANREAFALAEKSSARCTPYFPPPQEFEAHRARLGRP